MINYELGDKISNLRRKQQLTQQELAESVGLTNKAISKWETGKSMPTINELRKLAQIFDVSMDEICAFKPKEQKQIYKIAITGGPCSGKSLALQWLQKKLSKKDFSVIFISETATDIILSGVTPLNINTNENFQQSIIKMQLEKEKVFKEVAAELNSEKVLIVCDRGVIDSKAYMTNGEFYRVLKRLNLSEVDLRDDYDAVFHLVTAAKGAEQFYNYDNTARRESFEEAIVKDTKTLNAWVGHPRLRVIDNSTDFETKLHRLTAEILNFLGEPEPYEIEKRFLIEYPDIKKLEKMENCSKCEILQTYLKDNDSSELRVRQRGQNGHFTYTKTTKSRISNLKRIENETRISKNEYLQLLLDGDTNKRQIRKTRYCLAHKNQYFEIDIFPFWKDKAILEIELKDENQEIILPKFLNVIEEITNNPKYFNSNIAKNN